MRFFSTVLCLVSLFPVMLSCSGGSASEGNAAIATSGQSAATAAPDPASKAAAFDVDTAMAYLRRQVDFGPRVPGTDAHRRCADWLAATLASMGATVTDVTVPADNPATGDKVPVRNIFAQFNPDAARRVILLAHYDTRPVADEDPSPSNRSKPIDGANDGASGVAVILETARHASLLKPSEGLDILFADMEDSGESGNDDTWCLGSARWASSDMPYTANNMPRYGILLDMVGGRGAVFPREYFSETYAPAVNAMVWSAAESAGHGSLFVNTAGDAINDDHLSLLRAGIPTVDIIDMRPDGFNPTWHTLDDNIDNIDPLTIKAVGETVMKTVF